MKDNDNLYIDRLFLTIPLDPISSFKELLSNVVYEKN
jgi:hypothetical protein